MNVPRLTIALVASALFLFGCRAKQNDSFLEASYQRLKAIPQSQWDSLAQKKIFFGHQSVGRNIIDGLHKVMEAEPMIRLDIRETAQPQDIEGPIFAHFPIGQNRDPEGKIDHFSRLLEDGIGQAVDIAFFKFCYVDVEQTTDVQALSERYEIMMKNIANSFPDAIIIPVTVPLTNTTPGIKARIKRLLGRGPAIKADNIKRNVLNDLMRERYGNNLWDLANVEAISPQGIKTAFRKDEKTYFLLSPDYTDDGGHLNSFGSQVVAIDLLVRLASLDTDGSFKQDPS